MYNKFFNTETYKIKKLINEISENILYLSTQFELLDTWVRNNNNVINLNNRNKIIPIILMYTNQLNYFRLTSHIETEYKNIFDFKVKKLTLSCRFNKNSSIDSFFLQSSDYHFMDLNPKKMKFTLLNKEETKEKIANSKIIEDLTLIKEEFFKTNKNYKIMLELINEISQKEPNTEIIKNYIIKMKEYKVFLWTVFLFGTKDFQKKLIPYLSENNMMVNIEKMIQILDDVYSVFKNNQNGYDCSDSLEFIIMIEAQNLKKDLLSHGEIYNLINMTNLYINLNKDLVDNQINKPKIKL